VVSNFKNQAFSPRNTQFRSSSAGPVITNNFITGNLTTSRVNNQNLTTHNSAYKVGRSLENYPKKDAIIERDGLSTGKNVKVNFGKVNKNLYVGSRV
jgi:predicted phosphoribosyltransferase